MKFLKLSLASVLFLGITTVMSCKKEDDKKTPTPTESCTNNNYLKFIKVGNKWTYNYAELSLSEDTLVSWEITGTALGDAYKMSITQGGGTYFGGLKDRYIKECNDWFLVNPTTSPTSANDKSYPAIRKKGDKWTVGSGSNSASYEVLETSVSTKTEAGTFICDKISFQTNGAFNVDTVYFSNEIGWVKYVGFMIEYDLKSKNF